MRSFSFSASSWERVASFWLAFCFTLVQVPLTAQSTNSGLGQSESKPSAVLSLSKVSSELRLTLKDLVESYPQLIAESSSLRDQVKSLSEQVSALSSSSATWEADSKRLTDSVKSLTTQFEEAQAASDERARINAEAIAQARKERDEARSSLAWVGAGGVAVGVILATILNLAK